VAPGGDPARARGDAVAATDGDRAAVLALLADHPPVTTPAQAARLLVDAVARLS